MRLILFAALVAAALPARASIPAGPAAGWAKTRGGQGGTILPVTNLNADCPGSFKAALQQNGPRIIVFEVGGIIDLGLSTLEVTEPHLTIAG